MYISCDFVLYSDCSVTAGTPKGVRGRMIFMRRLLVCIEMTSTAQHCGYARHRGVIVVQRAQGGPDELHEVRMV